MNQNANVVKLPKGATHKGKEILKVLHVSISDNDKENGYMVVNEDGDKVFMKAKDVEAAQAGEDESDEEESPKEGKK